MSSGAGWAFVGKRESFRARESVISHRRQAVNGTLTADPHSTA